MIYYFSGTGNSRYVAAKLSENLGLELRFIPATDPKEENTPGEKVIFVFPVYSWGVPPLVLSFISKLPQSFIDTVKNKDVPVDIVLVCGDETAMAPEMFEKSLKERGLRLHSARSVIMPNNYVLLPGFDTDPKETEERKLRACDERISEIGESIRENISEIDVVRGRMPRLKTNVVYPLFKKWGIFPKRWHYTEGCISCGKCAANCPLHNVKMKNGHPEWGSHCCSCLACYHICPEHSVEYGGVTKKKGQYFFPLKRI